MSTPQWNKDNIPNQKGRVVVITGSTSGLGKENARILAEKGASVIMAVRNTEKGESVANEIKAQLPEADIAVRALDLASLQSIASFCSAFLQDFDRLDILINNAGIMMCPYSKTVDGFEMQMGTNHLGHFALTAQLMGLLYKTDGSRIVNVSSMGHLGGKINFSDLNWENRKYLAGGAYADSKLANLYFTYELAEKLDGKSGLPLVTAAHPGWTATELQRHAGFFKHLNPIFSQEPDIGCLPTLRAAIDAEAEAGDYFGPSGILELKGYPVKVKSRGRSHEKAAAKRLWALSDEMTGVKFDFVYRDIKESKGIEANIKHSTNND